MLISNYSNNAFIRSNYSQIIQKQPTISLTPQLTADTVSFGSKDLLTLPNDELSIKIKETLLDNKNFIGQGAEAEVFRIPDTNYCVRVLYEDEDYTSAIPSVLKRKHLAISNKLSEQEKINHAVAKFSNGTLMKYIPGTPVMTPEMSVSEVKEIAKVIEDAPLSSFQNLLRQISHAYENNMMFDCSYGNLLVNPKDKSIIAIDFYNMEDLPEPAHPLCHMYSGFTHIHTTDAQKKSYAGNILKASLEEVVPGHKPCLNVTNFDFYKFIYRLHNENIIESRKYTELMVKCFEDIENLKLKEFRGFDVKDAINGQIKTAKALIKQLL